MVFYHGECGLRDPRTPSVSRASWARTISGSDRNRWLLILPASSSGGWKESGLSEELVHLGPTHISSLTLSIELCLRYVNKCAELTRGIHLRVIRPDRDFWGHNSLMLEECSTFHLAELIWLLWEFDGRREEATPLYSANGPAMDSLALQLCHSCRSGGADGRSC